MKNDRGIVGPIIHCSPDLTKVELCRMVINDVERIFLMEILVLMIICAVCKFIYQEIVKATHEVRDSKTYEEMCNEEVDISNLPAFKRMLKNFLYRRERKYNNHCWKCKKSIDSDKNMRCPFCGWYICSCGNCKQDCKRKGNFDYLFCCPDEFLEKIRISALNSGIFNEKVPVFTRTVHFFAYLDENEEVQQIKKEFLNYKNNTPRFMPGRIEKHIMPKDEILKSLKSLKINDIVYHDKFGKGTILQINQEKKVVEIEFDVEKKRFVYPNAFLDGFLEKQESLSNYGDN